ncbi:MAG: aspartyl/asparaginyl beta-hydroxylase domain-containing protein [Dokdonella sp.]
MRPQSFYPLDAFPGVKVLSDGWETIRAEFLALKAPVLSIDRVDKTHAEAFAEIHQHVRAGGEFGWLLGWRTNPDWIQYALVLNDAPLPFVADLFPNTLALLGRLPGIKVGGFSQLKPHGFLATHRHPELAEENLLQCHVTLDAPVEGNYCYLNVNGEFRQHTNGAAIVFDGSLDHFAVNASAAARTILYLEFDPAKASAPAP